MGLLSSQPPSCARAPAPQVFLRLYASEGWVEGTPAAALGARAYVAPANSSEYLGSLMANACIMDGGVWC